MKTDRECLQQASQLLEEIYKDLKLRSELHDDDDTQVLNISDGLLSRINRISVDIKHHLFTVKESQKPVLYIDDVNLECALKSEKGALRYVMRHKEQSSDIALYVSPPQRKPLSDAEIDKHFLSEIRNVGAARAFARAIEAAHGITE